MVLMCHHSSHIDFLKFFLNRNIVEYPKAKDKQNHQFCFYPEETDTVITLTCEWTNITGFATQLN